MGWVDDLFRIRGLATVAIADSSTPTVVGARDSQAFLIVASGAVTAPRTIILPHRAGAPWIVQNTLAQTLTARGATGAGVDIVAGGQAIVFSTGADFVAVGSGVASPSSTLYGAFSARPAAGTPGRVYYTSDGPIAFVDDGASWQPVIPGSIVGTRTPAAAGWTGVGANAVIADSLGSLLFTSANYSAVRCSAATRAWNDAKIYTGHFMWPASLAAGVDQGLCLIDAGGSIRAVGLNWSSNVGPYWFTSSWSSATIRSSFVGPTSYAPGLWRDVWMRARKIGGSYQIGVSANGVDWDEPAAFLFGAFTPTTVGLFTESGSAAGAMRVDSWSEV